MSLNDLLKILETYVTKVTAVSFPEFELKRHQSIYELIFQEVRHYLANFQAMVDEKLHLQTADLESSKIKKGSPALETSADYAKIIKEINQWFKFAREKYGISVSISLLDAH